NVPSRVQSAFTIETVAKLAEMEPIVGIKDSSGNFGLFQDLLILAANLDDFAVFQGDELAMGASCLMGADGIVPGIGNLDPVRCVQLYEAALRKENEKVITLQREIRELCKVFSLGSPYGALKTALNMLGLTQPYQTAP